jgi:hypothetical protein
LAPWWRRWFGGKVVNMTSLKYAQGVSLDCAKESALAMIEIEGPMFSLLCCTNLVLILVSLIYMIDVRLFLSALVE